MAVLPFGATGFQPRIVYYKTANISKQWFSDICANRSLETGDLWFSHPLPSTSWPQVAPRSIRRQPQSKKEIMDNSRKTSARWLLRSGVWFRGYPYRMWFGIGPLFPVLERKTYFLVSTVGRFSLLKFSPEHFLIVKIRTSHRKLSALYNAISIIQIEWELAWLRCKYCVLCKTAKCGLLRRRQNLIFCLKPAS